MATQAFTPNMDTMARVCQDALASPNGLTLKFTVAKLGSLEACHARAKSTQNTFTSLRARSRRLTPAERGSRDHFKRGDDDTLVCRREPLPDNEGWCVRFLHAIDMFSDVEIADGNGDPFGPDVAEIRELEHKLWHKFSHFTPFDYDRLKELRGDDVFNVPEMGINLQRSDCDGRERLTSPPLYNPSSTDPAKAVKLGDLFDEGADADPDHEGV